MKLHVEPGNEKYIKWAKSKLRVLMALRKELNLPKLVKVFIPQSGVMIHIMTSESDDFIRITGASAAGRQYFSSVGGNSVHRFYRVSEKGNKIEAYSELEAGVNYSDSQIVSLNGRTAAGIDSATNLFHASVDGSTKATMDSGVYNYTTLRRPAAGSLGSNARINRVVDNSTRGVSVTEKGKYVGFARSHSSLGTHIAPVIVSLQKVETAPSVFETQSTVLIEGIPQFVLDFYSSLSPAHNLDSLITPVGELHRAHVPFAGVSGAFEVRVRNPYTTAQVTGGYVEVRPYYDSYNDQFCCVALMPFISSLSEVDIGSSTFVIFVSFGFRMEFRTFDPETQTWTLVYEEQYNETVKDGDIGGGQQGSAGQIVTYDTTTMDAGSDFNSIPVVSSLTYKAGVAYDLPARLLGIYPSGGNYELRANGVTLPGGTVPGGAEGVIHTSGSAGNVLSSDSSDRWWLGSWGAVDLGSPTSTYLWSDATGANLWLQRGDDFEFWSNGVLITTVDTAPVTPDASTLITHGTVPATGMYGFAPVDADGPPILGWRYDLQHLTKARVLRRVIQTGGGTMTLQGGQLIVEGFGVFDIPLTDPVVDGFSLDGTLYWSNGTPFTEAEVSAQFGGAATTFAPNGNQYEVVFGSATYGWEIRTADVTYENGAVRVVELYDDTNVSIPSRGKLVETLPGVTSVDVSKTTLSSDALVMRPKSRPVI